jgi:predicted O-methyltransferase YrrM
MGNVSLFELEVISRIVAYYQPRKIFELGTFDGRTTLNMALNTPKDTHIYTLDLPKADIGKTKYAVHDYEIGLINKNESGVRFKGKPEAFKITQFYGDTATFDFSVYHGQMDLIFIDASHIRAYIENDTQKALLMRRPFGIILWHDYSNAPDVTAVLEHHHRYDWRFRNLLHICGTNLAIMADGIQVPPAYSLYKICSQESFKT